MRPEPASNPGRASDEFPRVGRRLLMTLGSTSDLRLGGSMALSPDGSKLAFGGVKGEASSHQLFVRELSQLEATAVPLSDQFSKLCFSPDGQEMVFVVPQERAIKKVAVKGGEVFTLCRTKEVADYGLDWGEDGRIVFATGAEGGILEVKASGSDGVVKEIPLMREPMGIYECSTWFTPRRRVGKRVTSSIFSRSSDIKITVNSLQMVNGSPTFRQKWGMGLAFLLVAWVHLLRRKLA